MSLTARNRNKKRHDLRRILLTCAGGLVGASTLVAAHSFTLVRDSLRDAQCDSIKLGENSRIYDVNGQLLTTIAAEQNRLAIRLDQMPQNLIDATVSIEDKKFYRHGGVDYARIIGALVKNAESTDGKQQGGSTLTMQLMKNLCHPATDKRYVTRTASLKLEEAYWAKEFENENSKDQIMQRYLNSVFYGNNSLGILAAAKTYFDTDPLKLTLTQSALLAGLPQAPSAYNPFRNPKRATTRRNLVLDEMAKDGVITQAEAEAAKAKGLGLKRGNDFQEKKEGFYVDYVAEQLRASLGGGKKGDTKLKEGGFRVYTSIDPKLQAAARDVMRKFVARRWGTSDPPSAALVTIDARTGLVKAMASTDRYTTKTQFNLAGPTAGRNAGSTFKVFVLTAALRAGMSPSTRYFSQSPININGANCGSPAGSFPALRTFGGKGGGMRTLVTATTASDNSVYGQLTCDLGPEAVYQTAKEMGITSLTPSGIYTDRENISLGLGAVYKGISVLDMARAYAPLANGGYRVNIMPMTKLVRRDGRTTVFKPKRTKIFSDGVAAEATKILRQNVLGGTGTAANLPNTPVAGKTGTTNGFKDAWFVGYTPRYVTAVWIGYPLGERATGETGGQTAAPIWHDFMTIATKALGESGDAFLTPKEAFVTKSFSGYYQRQAAALAAAEAKKKADADKKKAEEEAKAKDKNGNGIPDDEEVPDKKPPTKTPVTPPTTPTTPTPTPPVTPPVTPPTTTTP
jgi:penicillin-binding protein 1A